MNLLYNQVQLNQLAEFICQYSLVVEKGSLVILEGIDVPSEDLKLVSEVIVNHGYECIILYKSDNLNHINNRNEAINFPYYQAQFELDILKKAKAFVGLRCPLKNTSKVNDQTRKKVIEDYINPVHFEYRNNNLQWLYCRLPTIDWCGKDFDIDSYFKSIQINFESFENEIRALNQRMNECHSIRLIGNQSHLEFSNSGKGVVNSLGKHNLPDGEIFFAPEKLSVNGKIEFNIPSYYWGQKFDNISLTFKEGQVIEAQSSFNSYELKKIVGFDPGSAYCGEFAIGLNPFISDFITDILYDEKMHGSFHLALGNAYPESDNGNRSGVHWDLIQDMRMDNTEMYFDNQLMMKDGIFIDRELKHLNKASLIRKIKYEK